MDEWGDAASMRRMLAGMAMMAGLEAAVRAGVIDRQTALRLEPYLLDGDLRSGSADPDDEKLRLVTGFNDIFVTIGIAMFLGALGYLLQNAGTAAQALVVAIGAWGLAEFFTRLRRQALPSIVLLVVFVGAVFLAVLGALHGTGWSGITPEQTLAAGLAASGAALLHWWRFHVPITVAAGTAAVAAMLLALCAMAAPELIRDHPVAVFLPVGLAIFALAMWFDSSDLTRQTRRTDIAFWLHLLAAPIIVHPILLTAAGGAGLSGPGLVIVVFLLLATVALVVDRRAILVSSLSYLAYAAGTLIAAAGIEAPSLAVSVLAVGAVVLMLSAAWRPLRRAVMDALSDLGVRMATIATDETYAIMGALSLGADQNGQTPISITWTVFSPDGRNLGEARQENALPTDLVRKSWAEQAALAGGAAARSIAQIIASDFKPR